MKQLAEEALDLINRGLFRFTDPGPLHAPIRRFTVFRDDKRRLIVETETDTSASSNAVEPVIGRIMEITARATLEGLGGTRAVFDGVYRSSVSVIHADGQDGTLREKVSVHCVTVTMMEVEQPAYVIDWVENLSPGSFIWPESYETSTVTTATRTFGRTDECVVRTDREETRNFANSAAKFTIEGRTIYLCALDRASSEGELRSGCIVYLGVPDNAFREKVRVAISFTFGLHLVHLGHTLYNDAWHVVEAQAYTAYSMEMRAFGLNATPLVPIAPHSEYASLMTTELLNRAVNAFFDAYDDLDLSHLSWAYWHARTAATHIAPVHFGALIEALQRRYVDLCGSANVIDRIVPAAEWKEFGRSIVDVIAQGPGTDEQRQALANKVNTLNRLDQRPLLKAILDALGIRLSVAEDEAWGRRNKAAHGMPVPKGQSLSAIRDTHLLRGIFHRMLIQMTGASDRYVDYASLGFPHRPLGIPPQGDTLPGP